MRSITRNGVFAIVSAVFLASSASAAEPGRSGGLPKLLDLGSKSCIPCKMMAPILDELTREYAGKLEVEFVDVWLQENIPVAQKHGIRSIPTQIFLDKDGNELWRHEGFFSKEEILAKWQELGYALQASQQAKIERWQPAKKDERSKEQVCYLCDGDVSPAAAVIVKTDQGDVRLCGLHCYFILYSCLTGDMTGFEKKVFVSDYAGGGMLPAVEAVYLAGQDEATGRPWTKAFASRDAAVGERETLGGSLISWAALQRNELSHRCGFCDRACYPQDAALVLIDGVHSYGCCAHCAMGVAARTGKDIEVRQPDGLTGELVVVKTLGGQVVSVEPATAVAWFGKKLSQDGGWVSAGCFHQGFFATPGNLQAWLEQHPHETGEMISIQQSLADKMKLSPQQVQKACKIDGCSPK